MKAFADPRLAGYLEGIEQEIIEVTRAIEEARGRHAPRKAARLEVRRRRLYEDLAYGAELMTRRAAGRAVHIHAPPGATGLIGSRSTTVTRGNRCHPSITA